MNNNDNTKDTNTTPETAYEVVKHKKKKWPVILGICLAGAAAAIAIPVALSQTKSVKLSDFVSLTYDGISGYAKPMTVVDTEGLYKALAGDEKNTGRLETYKSFADSVSASVTGENVSNGDALEINVTFDEELRKNTGYKVKDEIYSVTAEGIDPGKSVNLFENASIDITGISPDATLKVGNDSSDEYLKTLTYSADKTTVANGDQVAIKCDVTDEELAAHGFTTTSLSAVYDVKGLSEYIGYGDLTKAMADRISEEDKKLIETETADDTYRMIYKLTNNAEYLSVPNTEKAENIEQTGLYFIKRKPETGKQGNPENCIIAVYKAVIKVQDREETGYFAFTYPDSYVTSDGKVEIKNDSLVDTLQMSTNEKTLTDENVLSRNGGYDVVRIDIAALSDDSGNEDSKTENADSGSNDPQETTGDATEENKTTDDGLN